MLSVSRSLCPCYFSHVVVEWTWKKVCILPSALQPCEPLDGLKILPGYIRLTCHSVSFEPPFGNTAFSNFSGNRGYYFSSIHWVDSCGSSWHPFKPPLWLSCVQQLDPICVHGFLDPTSVYFSLLESMALLTWMNLISSNFEAHVYPLFHTSLHALFTCLLLILQT